MTNFLFVVFLLFLLLPVLLLLVKASWRKKTGPSRLQRTGGCHSNPCSNTTTPTSAGAGGSA